MAKKKNKTFVLNVDLAPVVRIENGKKKFLRMLAWGDEFTVNKFGKDHLEVSTVELKEQPDGSVVAEPSPGLIFPKKMNPKDVVIPAGENRVLKVNFVDVQQGDGSVIETPDGKVILVDGGDNQLFARYLAGRFRNTTAARPKNIDCMLVTHGDADHFVGLPEIFNSETNPEPRKRLFIKVERVYHNGLVKGPSTVNKKKVLDKKLLGKTKDVDGQTIITELVDDLLKVPDARMNEPFRKWKAALAAWNKRQKIEFRSLSFGDDDAFDFVRTEALKIQVLGPILTTVGNTTGLKFLGSPPRGPRLGHESVNLEDKGFTGHSASHTINGHSIVLRIRYGGFSFLLSGDLNDESSRILGRSHQAGELSLRSEVFKVPHHGSADFSGAFFGMVSPIVSVVSSGDESARKEFIHPRATLMGALGQHSRVLEPLLFVTEMVAFFKKEGYSTLADEKAAKDRGQFFGFSRTAFGIVKTRTDGQRLLVYTDSGKADTKEAYAYELDENGEPVPSSVNKI
jgi:beta-lactamase superfamily II metal-dependent hydrolase